MRAGTGRKRQAGFPLTGALALFVTLTTGIGCRERPGSGAWTGTIDTLPNGTVRVRNPATGIWDSAAAWRIVEELRIGRAEGTGPDVFAAIHDLAVDHYGRMYVLDRQLQEIRVFDASGQYMGMLARKGSGPGELKFATGMEWDATGRLWVVDPGNARYSVFDTTRALVATHRRPIGGYEFAWSGGFDVVGRLHEWDAVRIGTQSRRVFIRLDDTVEPADTFSLPDYEERYLELRRGGLVRVIRSLPFGVSLVWRFDPRGYVWFGITDRYRIYQQSLHGDTLRIMEREYTRLPVTAAEKAEAMEELRSFIEQGGKVTPADIPDEKAAFRAIFIDDRGYLWVQPIVDGEETGKIFDVFDRDGRYLGQARSDAAVRPFPASPVFRGEYIYAVMVDELQIPYLIRGRIVGQGVAP